MHFLDLLIEDVILRPDGIDDEKHDDRSLPFSGDFEVLHFPLILFPQGRQRRLIESENLFRHLFKGLIEHKNLTTGDKLALILPIPDDNVNIHIQITLVFLAAIMIV